MVTTSRVTRRGQVTIPKAVRVRLGLQPWDAVEFVEDTAGVRIRKLVSESPFNKYRGYLKEFAGQDPDHLVVASREQ
ncbi:MAG: AbrB/MazE/SpoVT family DNA-binding domain-containing protein [Dehalococcoidia bacterium]|nr:AbrB/MazE/SpoVT family DNA-binding domain-containing protein [Dehalococcoidia bacterium]